MKNSFKISYFLIWITLRRFPDSNLELNFKTSASSGTEQLWVEKGTKMNKTNLAKSNSFLSVLIGQFRNYFGPSSKYSLDSKNIVVSDETLYEICCKCYESHHRESRIGLAYLNIVYKKAKTYLKLSRSYTTLSIMSFW